MVRGRARSPKIGLFQAGTHRIADTPRCPIHHPAINEIAGALRDAIRETGIEPYADRPHRGRVRALQVVVERVSDRAQVTLVGNDSTPASLEPLAEELSRRLGDRIQGLWWNGNPERTNTILGAHWHHWSGEECSVESVAGARIHSPPGAFTQSHPEMAERIARAVDRHVPTGSRVAELYAGSGALTLGLLGRVDRLHLNELNPHGLRGLELGLAEWDAALRDRARIWPGRAESCLEALVDVDCIVVDPPRAGLGVEVGAAVAAANAARLVYVSCGLDSLLRDAERLEGGGWRAVHAEAFDAFPYTEHIETLAVFERGGRDGQA